MIVLVILLLLLTVGYAALSENLNIYGTSRINSSTWDVHFENYKETDNSTVQPESGKAPDTSGNNKTEVSFEVTFNEPGDIYEFTIDAKNGGSIDAMIEKVETTMKIIGASGTSYDEVDWLSYAVSYEDGTKIEEKHLLKATEAETYKVRVEFVKDITNEQFDEATGKTIECNFGVNFIQADSSGIIAHDVDIYISEADSSLNIGGTPSASQGGHLYYSLDDALKGGKKTRINDWCSSEIDYKDSWTESYNTCVSEFNSEKATCQSGLNSLLSKCQTEYSSNDNSNKCINEFESDALDNCSDYYQVDDYISYCSHYYNGEYSSYYDCDSDNSEGWYNRGVSNACSDQYSEMQRGILEYNACMSKYENIPMSAISGKVNANNKVTKVTGLTIIYRNVSYVISLNKDDYSSNVSTLKSLFGESNCQESYDDYFDRSTGYVCRMTIDSNIPELVIYTSTEGELFATINAYYHWFDSEGGRIDFR